MDKIDELLTRGVDTIYPSKEELEKVLRTGKKLTLYQGFDPTGTQLHIGHMVGLRKLRQWQDLEHHVIFLIGDGTGQAGDPSGKTRAREKFLTQKELRQNAADYVKQAKKIVRFEDENPIEIRFNGDWLNKLTLIDILEIAGHFSLQQLAERDMFADRMKRGEGVNLREFLYPLLQGYDSVAMNIDLEVGGTDQTFNMLCGRTLVKAMQQREKFVMTIPLLTDSEGRKIGKTEENVIALNDIPNDLYARIMALPDEIIVKAFEYLTDISMGEVGSIEQKLKNGTHPLEYKKKLAYEITKELNGKNDAKQAQVSFEKTVQKKETPTDIPTKQIKSSDASISDILVELKLAPSKSDAKRLIEQGGVRIDGKQVTESMTLLSSIALSGITIQVGKIKFVKVTW